MRTLTGSGADAQARAEEARASAETLLREAREQADRTISGLSTKRDALVEQLATMQERLIGVAHDLESTISSPEAIPAPATDETSGAPPAEAEATEPEPVEGPVERMIVLDDAGTGIGITDEPGADADEEAGTALLDPSFEELWDGTEAIALDLPDIAPLDLDWGEIDDEDGVR